MGSGAAVSVGLARRIPGKIHLAHHYRPDNLFFVLCLSVLSLNLSSIRAASCYNTLLEMKVV
jgi:hypothetical protein